MEKINKILGQQSRYKRIQKPLEAASVCQAATSCIEPPYHIVSFKGGLLTVGTRTMAAAANLQMKSVQIIKCVNKKIGRELVQRLRYKII
ncbi:MAG: DciA family protein [Patescibacteria group bacterium]|jgi:GTP-sensing pleiotropic transcriptional regulator CodY